MPGALCSLTSQASRDRLAVERETAFRPLSTFALAIGLPRATILCQDDPATRCGRGYFCCR